MFCRGQLGELNERLGELERAGAALAAISGDTVAESRAWQAEEDPEDRLRFPLLADPDLKVCKAYGVYDAHNGFTLPAVIVVHREDGTVGFVRPSDSIADRPSVEDVLEAVRDVGR